MKLKKKNWVVGGWNLKNIYIQLKWDPKTINQVNLG
jgi:hypothetical protein